MCCPSRNHMGVEAGMGHGMDHQLFLYWYRFAGSGAAGAIGRSGLAFVETLVTLAVVTKEIAKPSGGVHVLVIVIAEGDDRGVFIQHPDKDRAVAVPPTVVIDQFFPIGDHQHAPAEAIVALTGLFKAVSGIGAVQDALREQLPRA